MDNKHQCITNIGVTIHGSHNDVTERHAAPPVKQYSDYHGAVRYGTDHETGLKTVKPRNLQKSAYHRADRSSDRMERCVELDLELD